MITSIVKNTVYSKRCNLSMQCGQPMEKGRCLECGEEVGGENHRALPGFKPVQLQQ